MEDCFPFPLWVEGDWNPGIPNLKNKLNIYFQSRKANGGDCSVTLDDDALNGQRAVVRFKTEEVRRKVLEKQGHELKLGQGVVKLTVRVPQSEDNCSNFPGTSGEILRRKVLEKQGHELKLGQGVVKLTVRVPQSEDNCSNFPGTSGEISSLPSGSLPTVPDGADGTRPSTQNQEEAMEMDTVQEDVAAEAEAVLETASVLLENVPEKMNKVMMEMLVENISDTSVEQGDFSLEIIPDISAAVVSFKDSKKVSHFLSKSSSNKLFTRNKLSARPLEFTTSVKVDKIPHNVSTDHLQLYFEREGKGEVAEVIKLEDEQSALITFKHHKGVNEVSKKKHSIQDTPISVYPYYESLGTALYGEERPTLKLPDSFTERMDSAVWKFLHNKKLVEEISEIMAGIFCKVDLQSPEVHISPLPDLLKQKGLNTKQINGWKEKAIATFNLTVSKFQSIECKVMPVVWRESETEICRALTDAVVIVPDMVRGVVALAGRAEDVNNLKDVLVSSVDTATKKFERERDSIVEEVSLPSSVYHILQQDGLPQKIATSYPELKVTFCQEDQKMTLCGLRTEVYAAKVKVLEQIMALKRKAVEVEDNVLAFLREADKDELCDLLFTVEGITARYETGDGGVDLVGATDQALRDAENQLKTLLGSHSIMVEDQNVLTKPEWLDLVTSLTESFNVPAKTVTVRRIGFDTKQEVVVSGFQDSVNEVGQKLGKFMSNNTTVEEIMDINSRATLKFIQDHRKKNSSGDVEKDLKVKYNYETRRPSIIMEGPRAHVVEFKNVLQNVISSVHFDTLKIAKPGAKKFFKEKQHLLMGKAADEVGCVIQLVEEDSDEGSEDGKCIQVPGGPAIVIRKADISQYRVDAVVYAANEKLSQEGGLAGALLKAAGPKLQEQCNHIITTKGRLSPGEAIITNAGQLPCKYIIHSACPRFDQANVQMSVSVLRQAVKQSLILAGENGCLSVALPPIGSGNMGFPLDMSIQAITMEIKEYCEDLYVGNILRKIHLVANDDKTVQDMEDAVHKVFTNLLYSQKAMPQTSLATAEKQHGKPQSSPGQDRVKTKEGLTFLLSKGNIQDASTDVIVNTLGKDLSLDFGCVSKAILKAAGPELQNLVQAEADENNPTKVLITKGCSLKCKHVFHAIVPRWDKGKGQTEKVLESIVEECLQKAEELQQRSIAFSAIGSGNLGFPKDFVASMFMGQVLSFSSKKPKHLQEVVIVLHPSDPETTQAFYNEFSKKFTGATGVSLKQPANPAAGSTQPGQGLFSKVTVTNQGHEMSVGGVLLQVVSGDITKETTDVIVNSSNAGFTLRAGVSKAILDAAGPAMDAECKQLGAQPNQDMIMTQSGNLKSKKVIHIVGHTDVTKITGSVKAVLQKCAQNKFTSVSFPALATGQGGVNPSQVADAMLDAVADVAQQDPAMSVKLVRVVIFQAPMLADFSSSMQKREATGTQPSVPKVGAKRFKLFWQRDEEEDKKKAKNSGLGGETFDPVIFHLCGGSQAIVENSKRWIQDLLQQELVFQTVTDEAILELSEENHRKLKELQQRLQVSIRLEEGDPEASIIIEGLSRDVLKAMTSIQDMLKKARHIDKLGEQETRDLPNHWSAMSADQMCLMILLQAESQEHNEVLKLFQATCPRQVLKIERVQNPCLWKNFQILKQTMDQTNGHQNNERRLFHGTSQDTIQHINHRGFNRSYAGKNAAFHGNGTYFAVAASYSSRDKYSVPDAEDQKYMYLCRVLTGDFTKGTPGMIVPPPKSNSSPVLYNSVTDEPSNPSMFIIFSDIQAYPEYLITFK